MQRTLTSLGLTGFLIMGISLLVPTSISAQNATITATIGTPTMDGVESPGEWTSNSITTSRGVTIKSMVDAGNFYVLATWPDAAASVTKDQWTFDGTSWSQSGDEDRIMFVWDMGFSGTDGASCAAYCHVPDMSTNEGRVGVWHWKATRFNPMGNADDKYWDTTGRHSDNGSGSGDSNKNVAGDAPKYMSAGDPGANVTFLTDTQAVQDAFDPFNVQPGSADVKVDFNPAATFAAGATIPGRILKQVTGNRGSAQSAGKWADGMWTVEFRRKLSGELGTDGGTQDFTIPRSGSVQFSNDIFDDLADHGAHSFSQAGLSATADFTVWTINFPAERLFFSQFGNGTGLTSATVLTNPSATNTVAGTVDIFDDSGLPLPIGMAAVDGDLAPLDRVIFPAQAVSSVSFSVAPLASVSIVTDGQGDLAVGSAVVIPDGDLGGVIRFDLSGFGIAGVGASPPLSGFVIPVRRQLGGINTGIAVYNTEGQAVTLNLTLRDALGAEVPNGTNTIDNLVANGHLAQFIDGLLPDASTDDFEGTLEVRVTGGKVAATAIEQGPGLLTTLPVTAIQ